MISTLGRSHSVTPNGTDKVFTFPHALIAAADLTVTVDGIVQSAYVVYPVSDTGATVTFTVAPLAGTVLLMKRVTPTNQLVDYVANESFNADTHENALDKLTLILQELGDDDTAFINNGDLVYWEESSTTLQPVISGYNFGAVTNRIGDILSNGDISAATMTGVAVDNTSTISIYTEVLAASHTLSAVECYGSVYYVNSAATITLPAAAVGMCVTVITIGAIEVSVKPDATDLIVLEGLALDDGDKITNASLSGDIAVLTYYGTTGWYAATTSWTDGGA